MIYFEPVSEKRARFFESECTSQCSRILVHREQKGVDDYEEAAGDNAVTTTHERIQNDSMVRGGRGVGRLGLRMIRGLADGQRSGPVEISMVGMVFVKKDNPPTRACVVGSLAISPRMNLAISPANFSGSRITI